MSENPFIYSFRNFFSLSIAALMKFSSFSLDRRQANNRERKWVEYCELLEHKINIKLKFFGEKTNICWFSTLSTKDPAHTHTANNKIHLYAYCFCILSLSLMPEDNIIFSCHNYFLAIKICFPMQCVHFLREREKERVYGVFGFMRLSNCSLAHFKHINYVLMAINLRKRLCWVCRHNVSQKRI